MGYLMTSGNVTVSAWARVHDSTSIDWAASHGEVEFTLGGSSGFELLASTEGLRRLVHEGVKALAELDAEAQIPDKPIHDLTMAELLANQHDQNTATSSGSPSQPRPPAKPHHTAQDGSSHKSAQTLRPAAESSSTLPTC